MFGEMSHEMEVEVPASEAWDLFGTLRIGKLVVNLKHLFQSVELVDGDGGVGTILELTFAPGIPGLTSYKEKFTKIDNENRIKETEVVEGGLLDMGFTLYRIHFQVFEKGEASCSVKSTIEYELPNELAANASLVSIDPLVMIFDLAKEHLLSLHGNTKPPAVS
ncbi:S-norcoclaurine synthase 2-like [Punica granatum]|uniref:Bet v I/Major latex protein domain-containing protein n=2 Tax=Punica granatum TaxID=22663 RepID=A0A218VSK4_PUNGR|nr:S-norcoclaurine synthase 2-like [Punica granatum]OWM63475.1 hypothetical protein CDL15_Pgr026235 [Punica granatum]PKI49870.1 hypothetical protein CRG98_029736 [Punica granatum]